MQRQIALPRLILVCVVSLACGLPAKSTCGAPRRVPTKTAWKGDPSIRFERDVLPLLTRFQCNSGNCHGATGGKGRLKLSLFGSRPIRDYVALVDGPGSDLIDEKDPKQSLLLRKATNTAKHAGGENMKSGSPAYTLLKRWIELKTPAPKPTDPRIVRLDVLPRHIEGKKATSFDWSCKPSITICAHAMSHAKRWFASGPRPTTTLPRSYLTAGSS